MPGGAPDNVDLSGQWELREDAAEERHRIDEAINRAAGGGISIRSGGGRSSAARRQRRGRDGQLVYVFLETGQSLKVTQTDAGMFLSFDRSVVEEYRFGENRMINVGEISAQRVSGWVDDKYVVESLDKNGMKLTERLWLSEDGNTLFRQFAFREDKDAPAVIVATQSYDRRN